MSTKVIMCIRRRERWEELECFECFRHLKLDMTVDKNMVIDENHRMGRGVEALGEIRSMWKEELLSLKGKMGMFEGKIIPIEFYKVLALKAK